MFEALLADVRSGARALRTSPVFAVVAVASLALGIGANTAIFTLVNAVMLRSLPVARPNELVVITRDDRPLTQPMLEELRRRQQVFTDVVGYASTRVDLHAGGEAHRVPMGFVSGGFFSMLGVRAALGRTLSADDDRPGCAPVAVVSDNFWRNELAARPLDTPSTVSLDGHPFQVVGVTAPEFFGIEIGYHVPVWVPLCTEAVFQGEADAGLRSRMGRIVVGRMKAGVTLPQVRAHLAAIRPAILDATVQYSAPKSGILMSPAEYRRTTFAAKPFANGDPALRLTYGDGLLTLMGVVAVVLLIACANVANLLLARATARQREIAVRLALGATRANVVRHVLAESLLLAAVGAIAGAGFAIWGSRLLVSMLSTAGQPIALDLAPDWRVLAFTIAVALVTGVAFGLVPAWRATRVDAGATMRPLGRGVIEGHSRFGMAKALVVGQIALSLVTVTLAGLLLGSWVRLVTLDPGYDRDHVLIVNVNTGSLPIPNEARSRAHLALADRMRALPGVTSAGAAAYAPLSSSWNTTIHVSAAPGAASERIVRMNEVSDRYFASVGTRLLAGRDFSGSEVPTSPRVAIVSERLAREFLGGRGAIGQHVRFGSPPGDPVEIVGIVADTKQSSLQDPPDAMVYFPMAQDTAPEAAVSITVRTSVPLAALAPTVRAALEEIDPRISYSLTTIANRLRAEVRLPRTLGMLAMFFGTLALVLGAIGLYGVMAYTLARRRGEIGIRMALGAARGRIVRLVLGDVARMVVAGIAIGVALSLVATRVVASLLYGVSPDDPSTFGTAAGLLATVALAAAALPIGRAARLDPMTALRDE